MIFKKNPFGNFNPESDSGGNSVQDYFKDQYKEFIHENSLVGIIGRITGAVLGTASIPRALIFYLEGLPLRGAVLQARFSLGLLQKAAGAGFIPALPCC